MQIPILNGIFTDNEPSLKASYPVNLMPVVQASGVSDGYLRPADGLVLKGESSGVCRGGILWNDVLYRVMGSKLVSIGANGQSTIIGDVGGSTAQVSMDYSFENLIVASNNNLFYYDGTTFQQVTDPDVGTVLDAIWVDGYTMTTDGEFIVVTDLNAPTSVDPFKYGSSEIDPDPIKALLKLRNEPYALNRYTIEVFDNVGGDYFPFQRVNGAQIPKGAVGTHACCVYMEMIAFVGGGRNEQPSVYMGMNGQVQRIATQAIDAILENFTEAQLSQIKVEARNDRSNHFLYIHLPDRTLIYDYEATQAAGEPVWAVLSSGINTLSRYKAINFVYAYNAWQCGDPTSSKVGYLTHEVSSHWGQVVTWEFGTKIIYNESRGGIFNQLELVALTGRIEQGKTPVISTSYSKDGYTWSQDRNISVGTIGDRLKRLVWFRQGSMREMRTQRFRGDSSAHVSFVRLEADIEPLYA
jgi:hypothetical protein